MNNVFTKYYKQNYTKYYAEIWFILSLYLCKINKNELWTNWFKVTKIETNKQTKNSVTKTKQTNLAPFANWFDIF